MVQNYHHIYSHGSDEEYELPAHMQSPIMKAKVNKYKTFRKVIHYLCDIEKYISKK